MFHIQQGGKFRIRIEGGDHIPGHLPFAVPIFIVGEIAGGLDSLGECTAPGSVRGTRDAGVIDVGPDATAVLNLHGIAVDVAIGPIDRSGLEYLARGREEKERENTPD